MAYPVYEESSTLSTGTDASVAINYTATVNANDILIAQMLDADNDSFSAPDGTWTEIYQEGANANATHAYFWKRAVGTETGTATFTSGLDAGAGVYGVMHRYSACEITGTPYEDATGAAITQTSTPTNPTIDTTSTERLALGFFSIEDNVATTGWTDFTEADNQSSAVGGDARLMHGYQQIATASTVTGDTLSGGNDYTGTLSLALLPVVNYSNVTGTAAITTTTSGVLTRGKTELVTGTAAIATTVAGKLTRQMFITGTSAIVAALEGVLTLGTRIFAVGTAAISTTLTGVLTRGTTHSVTGTASLSTSVAGVRLIDTIKPTGTSVLTTTVAGALTKEFFSTGTAAITTSITGKLGRTLLITGTSDLVSSAVSALTVTKQRRVAVVS